MRRNLVSTAVKLHRAFGSSEHRLSYLTERRHQLYHVVYRGYARGVRRTPVKVFQPDEITDVLKAREKAYNGKQTGPTKTGKVEGKRNEQNTHEGSQKHHDDRSVQESVRDQPGTADEHDEEMLVVDSSQTQHDQTKINFEKAHADDKRLRYV